MAAKVLANQLTVYEQAKRRANGEVQNIAEILEEVNEFLIDAPMYEANQVYTHISSVRTGLPTVSGRRINEGASKSSSQVEQITEQIAIIDVMAEIDELLIDHEPDPQKALMNEVKPFIEAGAQDFSKQILYGDPATDDTEIKGLAKRYADTSLDNVVSIGGSSNLSSVYIIEWGESASHLIYPRGAKNVGITQKDHGKMRVTDTSGNPYFAYVYQTKAEFGIAVKDARSVQRLANISTTATTQNNLFSASTAIRPFIKARNRLPHFGKNAVIYVNRDIKSQLDIWALEKANGFYTMKNIDGEPLTTFQGIPIRMVEQITSSETAVS